MARQNRRSGDIDFLSIAEGGSGAASLEAFRQQHEFVANDDPRVIKVLSAPGQGPELKINSVSDMNIIRPELVGPTTINIGETARFLIANRDISAVYSVESEHGSIRQSDGFIYFTPLENSSTIENFTFKVNGFIYSIAVNNVGPLAGSVLVSAVKTATNLILAISATEYKSNDGSTFAAFEYQIATDYDFDNVVDSGKTVQNSIQVIIDLTDVLYVRIRNISSNYATSQWFYGSPIVAANLKQNIAKPFGVAALTYDYDTYTLKIKGNKFLSSTGLSLKAVIVEEYSDSELTVLENETFITTTTENFQKSYTPVSTYGYIRFKYIDTANNQSDWSNTIRVGTSGAYVTLPVAEFQKIPEPTPFALGQFGFRTVISDDGKILVVSAFASNRDGMFYIYRRTVSGWVMSQLINYPDAPGSTAAAFGNILHISGDGKLIFVNAPYAFEDMSGAVYVYRYDEASDLWVKRDTISNHNKITNGSFSTSMHVTKDGSKLIIGDNFRYNLYAEKTRIDPVLYFYSYVNNAWVLDGSLSFPGSWANTSYRGQFGIGIAVNSTYDKLILTAPRHNVEKGIVFYAKKVSGVWTIIQNFTGADGLGDSLVANADLSELIIGAGQTNNIASITGTGVVEIYSYDTVNDRYSLSYTIPSPTTTGSGFGYKINANSTGNLLLIGARRVSDSAGEAHLYKKYSSEWRRVNTFEASDRKAGEEFGVEHRFDDANNEIVIGANAWGSSSIGSIYVFKPEVVEYTDTYMNSATGFEVIDQYTLPSFSALGQGLTISGDNNTLAFSVSTFENGIKIGRSVLHIYKRVNGNWVKRFEIKNNSPISDLDYNFAAIISLDYNGTRVAVNDNSGNARAGYFHVYRIDSEEPVLEFSRTETEYNRGNFASSLVKIDKNGELLIVGAPTAAISTGYQGAVYIYKRTGTTWTLHQRINSTKNNNNQLGTAGVISDDCSLIAIGEWLSTSTTTYVGGSVTIYQRNADGQYSEATSITTRNNTNVGANFGRMLVANGDFDRIAVSARRDNELSDNRGAIYIFKRTTGNNWIIEAKLNSPVPDADISLGIGLATNADMSILAVGGSGYNGTRGVIFIYKRTGSTWTHVKSLKPDTLISGDSFGVLIAMSSDGTELYARIAKGTNAYGSGQVAIFKL